MPTDDKFSELPVVPGTPVDADILALSRLTGTPTSYQSTFSNTFDYIKGKYIYGNGIDFDSGTNTLSVDINTTNLKFDSGVLNTIQDIDTNADPIFSSLQLNGPLGIFDSGLARIDLERTSAAAIQDISRISYIGKTDLGNSLVYARTCARTLDINEPGIDGAYDIAVTESGTVSVYETFDASKKNIEQFRPLVNLTGLQSFPIEQTLSSNNDVDSSIIGKTIFNSTSPITLTLKLNDTNELGASIDMVRSKSGSFTLTAEAGVSINGVDGDSYVIPDQYDRLKVTKSGVNEYSVIEYSGAVGQINWQYIYDNSTGSQFFDQADGASLKIRDANSVNAFLFETNTASNENILRMNNDSGNLQIIKQNFNSFGPQDISFDIDAALNSSSSQVQYVQNISSVLDATSGSEAAKKVINMREGVSLVPYLELDSQAKTIKVPNSTTKILDEVATLSDVSSGSDTWQDVYDNSVGDQSFTQNDSFPLVIKNASGLSAYTFEAISSGGTNLCLSATTGQSQLFLDRPELVGGTYQHGKIQFRSFNSLSSLHVYSSVFSTVLDNTSSSEKSQITCSVSDNGTLSAYLILNGSSQQVRLLNSTSKTIDTAATLSDISLQNSYDGGNSITLDGVNDLIVKNSSSDNIITVKDNGDIDFLSPTLNTFALERTGVTPNNTTSSISSFNAGNSLGSIKTLSSELCKYFDNTSGSEKAIKQTFILESGTPVCYFELNGSDEAVYFEKKTKFPQCKITSTASLIFNSSALLELESTTSGFAFPSMTNSQFQSIGTPMNGLSGWDNDNDRIIVNAGSPSSPVYEQVAYLSDITASDDLQEAYDVGSGSILLSGISKPFSIENTTSGSQYSLIQMKTTDSALGDIARINFVGNNALASPVTYGNISARIVANTAGAHAGGVTINVADESGTFSPSLDMVNIFGSKSSTFSSNLKAEYSSVGFSLIDSGTTGGESSFEIDTLLTDATPGSEDADYSIYGLSAGTKTLVTKYDGSANEFQIFRTTVWNAQSISGMADITCRGGGIFNDLATAGGFFQVKTSSQSKAFYMDLAAETAEFNIPLNLYGSSVGLNLVDTGNTGTESSFEIDTTLTDATPGSEDATFTISGLSAGIKRTVMTFQGSSDELQIFRGTVWNAQSISGMSDITCRGGAIFNDLATGAGFFQVKTAGESQAFYIDIGAQTSHFDIPLTCNKKLSHSSDIESTVTVASGSSPTGFVTPVVADEAISIGDLITTSGTTAYRFVKVKAADILTDTLIVGVADSAAAGAGNTFLLRTGPIATSVCDNSINLREGIEKSDITDGRVHGSGTPGTGTFGIALHSTTGAGENITFMFVKNDA